MLPSSPMLYAAHQLQRFVFDGVEAVSGAVARAGVPWWSPQASLLQRMTKRYGKPAFAVPGVAEVEEIARPFVRLLHFVPERGVAGPRVLLVAPLSGHHSTLLRDTVTTLLADHDVYVTDWRDARDVPVALGTFGLADYVAEIRAFLRHLGAARTHVIAVCQPTVPVLAAVALDAAAGAPTPRSLTLMGGPVDAREHPTAVNKLATEHSIERFETMAIHRVPAGHAGAGRRVYPGFLQLTAFVMMNPQRHLRAYGDYWLAKLRGDTEAAAVHESFYDEYNAVLDMDAAYYLETVRLVFQEFALARGTWRIDGELVTPAAITATPVFAIEGELDDISGLGQTAAALALCSGLAPSQKRAMVAAGCGHYGLFSGSRWRAAIYPEVRAFIADAEGLPAGTSSRAVPPDDRAAAPLADAAAAIAPTTAIAGEDFA